MDIIYKIKNYLNESVDKGVFPSACTGIYLVDKEKKLKITVFSKNSYKFKGKKH